MLLTKNVESYLGKVPICMQHFAVNPYLYYYRTGIK